MPHRILRNVGVVFTGEILARALEFLFIIWAANALGAAGFGLLSTAVAFTALFSFLTDMGLFQLTVRELAKNKDNARRIIGEVAGLKIALNVAVYAVMAASALLTGYSSEAVQLILLVGVSMVLESFNYLLNSVFQSYERLEYSALGRVIGATSLLASGLLSGWLGWGVFGYGMAYVLSRGLTAAYGLIVTARLFVMPLPTFHAGKWLSLLSESWPFGATLFITNIFLSADVLLVSYLRGTYEAGLYAAAAKLVVALGFILAPYNQAIYPALSRLHGNKEEFERISGFYLKNMLFLGIPMVAVTVTYAPQIMGRIYSAEYAPSAAILAILIWGALLGFLSSPYHRMLEATGRQKTVMWTIAAGTGLSIIFDLALIPKYGMTAAAYATILAQATFTAAPLLACAIHGLKPRLTARTATSLAAGLIAYAAVQQVLQTEPIIKIPAILAAYTIAYSLAGGLKDIGVGFPKKDRHPKIA